MEHLFCLFHYAGELQRACPVIFQKFTYFPKPTPETRHRGFYVFCSKSSAKVAILNPGPNVDRNLAWPRFQCRLEPGLARIYSDSTVRSAGTVPPPHRQPARSSAWKSPLADPHRGRWPSVAKLRARGPGDPGSGTRGPAPVDIGARGQKWDFCPTFFPEKHKILDNRPREWVLEKCRRPQK